MADAWKSTCERNLRNASAVKFSNVMSQFASFVNDNLLMHCFTLFAGPWTVFSRWRNANLAWGFACRLLVAFCCACVIRFTVFLMRPLCFMLSFLIRLPASPYVRTERQSDIGHNRGKKSI